MIHVKKKAGREREGRRHISERKGLRAKLKRQKMERTEKSSCRLMLLSVKAKRVGAFFF
jgi:hypothetical protein